MDLSIYDIIIGPVISASAQEKNMKLKQLVLKVHMQANKPLVALAIKTLFGAEVENVRILIRKGKRKRVPGKRITTVGSKEKRAIVTLKDGASLNLFDQSGHVPAAQEVQEQS
jgi:large subunit ribosomal protein L23